MKYYSEVLKKMFDDPFDLERAEEEDKMRVAKEQDEELMKQIAYDNAKATAKDNIVKLTNELDKAYENLGDAKKEVEELQKEYDKIVDSIMNPLVEQVKKYEKLKAEAIKHYNDNYGVAVTNEDLNKEFKDLFNKFWNNFYW